MCVYDTDTSAGTYSVFGPISPLGSHPLPRKRECVYTVKSFSYAWEADLALNFAANSVRAYLHLSATLPHEVV